MPVTEMLPFNLPLSFMVDLILLEYNQLRIWIELNIQLIRVMYLYHLNIQLAPNDNTCEIE